MPDFVQNAGTISFPCEHGRLLDRKPIKHLGTNFGFWSPRKLAGFPFCMQFLPFIGFKTCALSNSWLAQMLLARLSINGSHRLLVGDLDDISPRFPPHVRCC